MIITRPTIYSLEYGSTFAVGLFAALLLFTGCDSTEPDAERPIQQELVTRLQISLTPRTGSSATQTFTATSSDALIQSSSLDIDTITLAAGTTYDGTIRLFDDPNTLEVTEEIATDEANVHQIFYTPNDAISASVTVEYADTDPNGLPIGITFTVDVAPGASGAGTIRVELNHYTNVVKNGTVRADDREVDFDWPVTISG